MPANRISDSRLIIGLILVLIGAYLLLYNFNLIPFHLPDYLFSWQTLLIVLGLIIVGTRENKGGGITLIIIGIIFLLPEIFYISFRDIFRFWPLIFVIIGISILLRRSRTNTNDNFSTVSGIDTHFVDDAAIFTSSNKTIITDHFKGGKVTAIFGSAKIDLTQSEQAEGKFEIDTFALFGSVTLVVPNDWVVKNDANTVLGESSDKRRYHTSYNPVAEKQLVVNGVAILGSVALKSP